MPELTPSAELFVLVLILVLGLAFDFINGFHDTANAIATSVATRVLSPGRAVLMAGALNFVGALSGTAVATTVGKGLVPPELSAPAWPPAAGARSSSAAWRRLFRDWCSRHSSASCPRS